MKKLSFKNLSLLGLVLTGVSALTTAMIPSKSDAKVSGLPGNGRLVLSSFAGVPEPGNLTAVQTAAGPNSYTTTGAPGNNFDGLSATSQDDDGTLTVEKSNITLSGTTTQE